MDMNAIHSSQFGYVRDKSTTYQLLVLQAKIAKLLDKKTDFSCIFLDFKKAFDRVDHGVVLQKFALIASQETVNWLQSFLSERTISVRVDHTLSSSRAITCGVPQGSHLAPLLFLLFINDIPTVVSKNSDILMYA